MIIFMHKEFKDTTRLPSIKCLKIITKFTSFWEIPCTIIIFDRGNRKKKKKGEKNKDPNFNNRVPIYSVFRLFIFFNIRTIIPEQNYILSGS